MLFTLLALFGTAFAQDVPVIPTQAKLRAILPDDSSHYWKTVEIGMLETVLAIGTSLIRFNIVSPVISGSFEQVEAINTAVVDGVDGLVVDLDNFNQNVKRAIQNAQEAGVYIIVINYGQKEAKTVNALYIGSQSYQAGVIAARRLMKLGAKSILCVTQSKATTLMRRCQGAKSVFGDQHFEQIVAPLDAEAITIRRALTNSKTKVGALLCTGPELTAFCAEEAVANVRFTPLVGGFDLSDDVMDGISDGSIALAMDQQPYFQGSESINLLASYTFNRIIVQSKAILTGPILADRTGEPHVPFPLLRELVQQNKR